MFSGGQFRGIEDKVNACTQAVQDTLASYAVSAVGKSAYFDIEGRFYKYLGKIVEEIRNSGTDSTFVNLNGRTMPIKGYQEKFAHAVRFRAFTEDSTMLLAESLGKEGFDLAFDYKVGY